MHLHELNVQDLAGRSYVMKIRPSSTQDGKMEGAILVLTDIEALLRSQENRQGLESSLRSLLSEPPDLLLAVSPEGHCLFVNSSTAADVTAPVTESIHLRIPGSAGPGAHAAMFASGACRLARPRRQKFEGYSRGRPRARSVLIVEPILTAEGVLAFGVKAK